MELLEQYISIIIGSTIMAYSVYTFSAVDRHAMMFTIPFVIYGLFRYLYLLNNKETGDAPEEALLGDIPSLISVALCAVTSVFLLYDQFKFLLVGD